jgi:uncharacterized protein YgfB (UPF0149 family)
MTKLDRKFVDDAKKSPIEFQHGNHVVIFEASDAGDGTDLAVTMGGTVIGYVTGGSDDNHGVVAVNDLDNPAPARFHTLEGALEQLLPGVADGFAEPPVL